MLGMPAGDRDALRDWSHTLTLGLEPTARAAAPTRRSSTRPTTWSTHVLDAIEWKRAHPADDLLTALDRRRGRRRRGSPPTSCVDQVVLLFVAGHETTVNLIGNGTLALLRNRAQLERWQRRSVDRRERGRRAAALRLAGAVLAPRHHRRRRRRRAHDRARARSCSCASPPRTATPRTGATTRRQLDLTRPGAAAAPRVRQSGIHHCLGAALARLEGRIAIGTLVRRFPGLELAVDEPAWNGRLVLRGLDALPVTLGT